MAATRTLETFACIIDLFGVSNLVTFMRSVPPYREERRREADPDRAFSEGERRLATVLAGISAEEIEIGARLEMMGSM